MLIFTSQLGIRCRVWQRFAALPAEWSGVRRERWVEKESLNGEINEYSMMKHEMKFEAN